MGGWVGEDIGDMIEKYDPASNQWTLEGNLPEPRFSMGVVSYDGNKNPHKFTSLSKIFHFRFNIHGWRLFTI